MNKEEFYIYLKTTFGELSQIQKQQLENYCDFLLEYNKHTNLTAIRDEEGVYLKHFLDSISVLEKIDLNTEKVLDIGTGAGFPGVVLKIMRPKISLTLLDSNNKKTKFLLELLKVLNINDVAVINDRAEKFTKKAYYDVVISRALCELRIFAELSLPFLKTSGLAIAMKSNISDELPASLETIEVLGGENPKIEEITLPYLNERCLVIIKKSNFTPSIYPRVYDKILKYPLKKNDK